MTGVAIADRNKRVDVPFDFEIVNKFKKKKQLNV